MRLRTRILLLLAGPVMYALGCSAPDAPPEQGSVVFRFDRAAAGARSAHGGVADVFDSVAVSVFRGGAAFALEVRRGEAITADPVEMTLGCIAEPNKRVSVELFVDGVMYYHGANEDVDVVVNQSTDVTVDAYAFHVPSLSVNPGVLYEGASFDLAWSSTPGAQTYRVQASTASDFATVEWEQSLTDTFTTATLDPGSHYFRVAPATPYATGTFAGPEVRYVLGGSGAVVITGLSAVGVIPGEEFSVYGENLDFPDVQAAVGAEAAEIVSTSWGELVVRMPLAARSSYVTVGSSLGADMSSDPLIALRIAYVSATGLLAGAFGNVLWQSGDDIEWSGIAYLPLPELDTRDMGVFDVVMVASDSGTDVDDWGGDPRRAVAITSSGANVLAIGDGGAAFLRLSVSAFASVPVRTTTQTSVYASQPGAPVFTAPHAVTGGLPQWVDICQSPERCVAFEINPAAKPAGVSLYASSGVVNNRWLLADAVITDVSRTRRYFHWGLGGDPNAFTKEGQDCLRNAVHQLYSERGVATPTAAAR